MTVAIDKGGRLVAQQQALRREMQGFALGFEWLIVSSVPSLPEFTPRNGSKRFEMVELLETSTPNRIRNL